MRKVPQTGTFWGLTNDFLCGSLFHRTMRMEKAYIKKVMDMINAGKRTSPLKAIRAKCLDCMGFQLGEVRNCPSQDCPLWKYRFASNKSGARGKSKIDSAAVIRLRNR